MVGDLHAVAQLVADHCGRPLTIVSASPGGDGRSDAEATVVEALRRGESLTAREIIRRGSHHGCDLSGGTAVLVAIPSTESSPAAIAAAIRQWDRSALVEHTGRRVYALLPTDGADAGQSTRLARRLRGYGTVALSSRCPNPAGLPAAIREAELSLQTILATGDQNLNTGTYRLLLRLLAAAPEGLDALFESAFLPLAQHDANYRTGLVDTLRAYLTSNCNINQTARAMLVHRHTIAHRLERIRELTGLDPASYEEREQLSLGLKAELLLTSVA
jgi:sugar diacid utilization regulator